MALDFACRTFDINEVIRCGLGLSKTDISIMKKLINSRGKFFTAQEIAISSSLDLSTVQRSLKRLYEKGTLKRLQSNLAGGGYLFSYSSKPKKEIKGILLTTVHKWVSYVDDEFDRW
jgi:predicted transcriptional regulator